jgi:hypothetical protein
MTKIASSLLLAILLTLGPHVASAQAGLVRTCVSMAKGSDANASSQCHCSTPCRTFAIAAANTLADGEITVLDPGDYGGVTITRSISINNDSGGEASITVSGNATGIIVNAVNGASYVNLRGITIQGVGFGTTKGLTFNSGLFLTMTNCVVRNHTGDGIQFFPNAPSNFAVSNTLAGDNGGSGIRVFPSGSGPVKVALSRIEAYNNSTDGIAFDSSSMPSSSLIRTAVADSVVSGNGRYGLLHQRGMDLTVGIATIVTRSVIAGNGVGLQTLGPGGGLLLGESTVTGNTTAWAGSMNSYGNNNIDLNVNGDPAPPTIAKK